MHLRVDTLKAGWDEAVGGVGGAGGGCIMAPATAAGAPLAGAAPRALHVAMGRRPSALRQSHLRSHGSDASTLPGQLQLWGQAPPAGWAPHALRADAESPPLPTHSPPGRQRQLLRAWHQISCTTTYAHAHHALASRTSCYIFKTIDMTHSFHCLNTHTLTCIRTISTFISSYPLTERMDRLHILETLAPSRAGRRVFI